MKKLLNYYSVLFFTLLTSVLIVLPSCNKSDSNKIKIGVILPLTGKLSVIGEGEKQGLLLAIDTLKSKYPNVAFEVIFEDFASDTKNALTIANKLIDIDKVSAIITSTTAAAEVVSPIVDQKKIVHFVISPDLDILNKSIYNYRIYYNFNTEANVFNNQILKEKPRTISFLAVKYSSIQKMIDVKIEPYLKENNFNVQYKEYFDITEKDFKSYIAKMKDKNSDIIFLAPQVNQVELLANQLKESYTTSLKDKLVFASFTFNWSPQSFLNSLNGFNILSPKFQETDTLNPYFKSFKSKFGKNPNFDMLYAYDNLIVLLETLVKSNNDVVKFESIFNNITEYNGASGKIFFSKNRDTEVEIKVNKIQ